MLKTMFDTEIKPYNDELAGTLGVKKINLTSESKPYIVPVRVPVICHDGTIMLVNNQRLNFYLNLGLAMRRIYE